MHRVIQILLLSCVLLALSCLAIGDSWLWYEVSFRLVDESTGERVRSAQVHLNLFRDGEPINRPLPTLAGNSRGDRHVAIVSADQHGAAFGILTGICYSPCRELEWGDPPDEARITVRSHLQYGDATVHFDPTEITDGPFESISRTIDLGTIGVRLEPDCNANGIADSNEVTAGTAVDCAGES